MAKQDPEVDAYIAKSAEFAQPILIHLRKVVHTACPDVEETIKWNCPHFLYRGMLCSISAFKGHCAFSFRKGSLVVGTPGESKEATGQFGRITKLADLPAQKVLIGYVKKAMKLNEDGVEPPAKPKPVASKDLVIPDDLARALRHHGKAETAFHQLSPSHQREYVTWITEAKTEPTRAKRLATTIEWVVEGKSRNSKYSKKTE